MVFLFLTLASVNKPINQHYFYSCIHIFFIFFLSFLFFCFFLFYFFGLGIYSTCYSSKWIIIHSYCSVNYNAERENAKNLPVQGGEAEDVGDEDVKLVDGRSLLCFFLFFTFSLGVCLMLELDDEDDGEGMLVCQSYLLSFSVSVYVVCSCGFFSFLFVLLSLFILWFVSSVHSLLVSCSCPPCLYWKEMVAEGRFGWGAPVVAASMKNSEKSRMLELRSTLADDHGFELKDSHG